MQEFICNHCGKKFFDYPYKNRSYCSNACRGANIPKWISILGGKKAGSLNKGRKFPNSPKGADHPSWKGGITKAVKAMMNSREYKDWKFGVRAKFNNQCADCGTSEGRLDSHHIKDKKNFPELMFDINNGKLLCFSCHKKTSNYARR